MTIDFSEARDPDEAQKKVKQSLYPRLRKLGLRAKLKSQSISDIENEVNELLSSHKNVPQELIDHISQLLPTAKQLERAMIEKLKTTWLAEPSFNISVACGFEGHHEELKAFHEKNRELEYSYMLESGCFDEEDDEERAEISDMWELIKEQSKFLRVVPEALVTIAQRLDVIESKIDRLLSKKQAH